jgi:hypothetical protein
MISSTLAEALEARRSDFNARFRIAAQRYPQLDGDELKRFIADCLDPLVCAVHAREPAAVAAVVSAAYDCALQLAGQRLTLESGRYCNIPALWREVLPLTAGHVAEQPARVLGALSNAAHQLASLAEPAAGAWQQRMLAVLPACSNAQECLLAGQVNAWLCGLAHYREGALAALQSLRTALAAALLEVPVPRLESVRQRLQSDPWFDPAQHAPPGLRVVRYAGGFRGFGGAFVQPPLVKSAPGGWLVRSAGEHWLLVGDAFGATLHRVAATAWEAAKNLPVQHERERLVVGQHSLEIGGAGAITSGALSTPANSAAASLAAAAACTFAHSHQIALVALTGMR